MITTILHKPVAIAQHVVGGVARGGLHGAVAVAKRILPGDEDHRDQAASPSDSPPAKPTVSTDPVHQPPSPSTTVKKATTRTTTRTPARKVAVRKTAARKAPAKKVPGTRSTAKKAAAKKPAARLDEGPAPVADDPVVHSSGPDVTTSLPKDDLEDLRP